VFLDGAFGTRRGELGALRWSTATSTHELQRSTSYYLAQRRTSESDKNGSVGQVLPMHLSLKDRWWMEVADEYKGLGFRFPSCCKGKKPLDLAAFSKRRSPAFASVGILGVGWHTFRHTVGTMLADMGEHQLTIRDYLRHSNLHVTNKYLSSNAGEQTLGAGS